MAKKPTFPTSAGNPVGHNPNSMTAGTHGGSSNRVVGNAAQ
jgi:hypothetical protein